MVKDKDDCGDREMAALGPPGPVTVFSAATGAIGSPTGFAAAAASGILVGIITAIAVSAAAAGSRGRGRGEPRRYRPDAAAADREPDADPDAGTDPGADADAGHDVPVARLEQPAPVAARPLRPAAQVVALALSGAGVRSDAGRERPLQSSRPRPIAR